MKISKLFHWLYASIMLMPIFAIGTKCLYVALNKNAKDSYSESPVEEIVYTDVYYTNEDYYFNKSGSYVMNSTPMIKVDFIQLTTNNTDAQSYFNNNQSNIKYFRLIYYATNQIRLYFYDINQTQLDYNTIRDTNSLFMYFTTRENGSFNNDNLFYQIRYNDYSYLDNVFYYAVDEIKDQPIFSWANDSFINQPITYIGGLFGLQSDSAIYTLLSYWLSISIIWLTFDLLMYVPLLVHRWIDKGVLE